MEQIIKKYIDNLDETTIDKYAKSQDINLSNQELKIIYIYIKNYWQVFLKEDPRELFKELEEKIEKNNLDKIKNLYQEYKKRFSL